MSHTVHLDRLSALLGGLAPRVEMMRRDHADGPMRFTDAPAHMLWLHLVLNGCVQLEVEGAEPMFVTAPAIVICRAGTAHQLIAAADATGLPLELLCARAHLDGPVAPLLMTEFVQPMVVPLAQADASLEQVIHLVRAELNQPRCGQPLLLDRAGDILFIGLLRHLIAHTNSSSGLFNGLADPRIASTLVALHATPEANWRLESMAEQAGMSRTSFANRFRDALHTTPGKYLARLRLAIAQRAVASGDGLKQAARRTGYGNASALSRALSKARAETT
jgi:AraC-like DNA-binding protein